MNRVPPPSRPAGKAAPAPAPESSQAIRLRRRPSVTMERAKPGKSESTELAGAGAEAWAGVDIDKSLEVSMKDVEARLAQAESSEAGSSDAADEAREGAESADGAEKPEHGKDAHGKTDKHGKHAPLLKQAPPQKPQSKLATWLQNHKLTGKPAQSNTGQVKAHTPSAPRPQAAEPPKSKVSASSFSTLAPVKEVLTNKLAGATRTERPPDAFSLLKAAKEAGVFFQEDGHTEGHTEEKDDPALAAAVEETIRLLFGVRGVLRVGPGKNDENEAIVVVVATHGFTDAGFGKVPEKVHRFKTLVAIPFELLPLRRDR